MKTDDYPSYNNFQLDLHEISHEKSMKASRSSQKDSSHKNFSVLEKKKYAMPLQ